MAKIHPTSIVSRESELAEDVEIGPFCIITGPVRLGPGTRLLSHVCLNGPLTMGEGNLVYPGVCIGFPGQDVKFKLGDPTPGVRIGAQNIFREHVTIHAATKPDAPTTIGNRVFMMACGHVGHDARVADNVVMVNNSALGGHAEVQESATLGGGALIHQFGRVGKLSMIGGGCALSNDLPPYCLVYHPDLLIGINQVGCRRSGMPREHITRLRAAFRRVFWRQVTNTERLAILRELGRDCPPVLDMATFIEQSKRPILVVRRRGAASAGDDGGSAPG